MDEWNHMANDRKMKNHPAGFMVIVPNVIPDVVPVDCSVCGLLLKDFTDMIEHKKNGCCYNCSIKWAYPNSTRWESGWRPSPDEILKETEKRNCLPSFIYQVK